MRIHPVLLQFLSPDDAKRLVCCERAKNYRGRRNLAYYAKCLLRRMHKTRLMVLHSGVMFRRDHATLKGACSKYHGWAICHHVFYKDSAFTNEDRERQVHEARAAHSKLLPGELCRHNHGFPGQLRFPEIEDNPTRVGDEVRVEVTCFVCRRMYTYPSEGVALTSGQYFADWYRKWSQKYRGKREDFIREFFVNPNLPSSHATREIRFRFYAMRYCRPLAYLLSAFSIPCDLKRALFMAKVCDRCMQEETPHGTILSHLRRTFPPEARDFYGHSFSTPRTVF